MSANVADLLSRARSTRPEGVALVSAEDGTSLTWADLDDLASRVAVGLERCGLVAGNRVLIATGNRVEFVATYFGVLRARLVAVPVNPRSATGELVRMLTDSGARLVVADASTLDAVRSVVAGVAAAVTSEATPDRTGADRSPPVVPRVVALDRPAEPGETGFDELTSSEGVLPVALDPESLAVLLYTSGASGEPRAAMLTHRALLANIEQVGAIEPAMVRPDDVVYGVLPLFHVYGLNAVLGQVVHRAATLLLADSFDPVASLEHIAARQVSVVPIAPPVLAHWRQVPDFASALTSVRLLLSGSAPLSADLVEEFATTTGIEVHQGYGLTEASPVVTSTLASRAPKRGSVGVAVPGVSLRLVDETGAPLRAGGDPGEIQVSGDNLFSGYWPSGEHAPVEGWFATGDVGYLDEDGDLFLVDRLKELVVVSGFNVYPTEVEDVIAGAEGVREVAVIGVPDEDTGEAVLAYVRPEDSHQDRHDEVLASVRRACEARLARFKWPSRVEVVDDLPRTVTGKVAKGRMRATLRRERLGLLE